MIKLNEWKNVSNIRSSDFPISDEHLHIPERIRKSFPNNSLHEMATFLDRIPQNSDLSVEEGRALINCVLQNDHEEMIAPRTTPTPHVKPVRTPFEPSCEGKVTSEPPGRRPADEWEKIEGQVKEWLEVGEVEKSTSPFNIPHVVAKKPTPPHFRLAHARAHSHLQRTQNTAISCPACAQPPPRSILMTMITF